MEQEGKDRVQNEDRRGIIRGKRRELDIMKRQKEKLVVTLLRQTLQQLRQNSIRNLIADCLPRIM